MALADWLSGQAMNRVQFSASLFEVGREGREDAGAGLEQLQQTGSMRGVWA